MVVYNRRVLRALMAAGAVLCSLISVHLLAVNYSHRYSQISSSVGSMISDILVEKNSQLYKEFKFKGDYVPAYEDKVQWNNNQYVEEMDKELDLDEFSAYANADNTRSDAAFITVARTSDLRPLIATIKQIEGVFNAKYKYPYVIFYYEKGLLSYESRIRKLLPDREVYFERIRKRDGFGRPPHINKAAEKASAEKLKTEGLVPTTSLPLLKNLFRYFSYPIFEHPRLKQYKWYWRFEPGTNFFNDINYDVFQYMELNDKTFGFTMATYEYDPATVENLFPTVLKFLANNTQYIHPNNSKGYLMENLVNPENNKAAHGYSTCHFWSSFEIGNMEFFRSDIYKEYFKFLDESGGFYYDRWGDGPVHSLALSLFEDRSKLHWFKDIGYEQFPFFNCPENAVPNCEKAKFSVDDFLNLNCLPLWLNYGASDGKTEADKIELDEGGEYVSETDTEAKNGEVQDNEAESNEATEVVESDVAEKNSEPESNEVEADKADNKVETEETETSESDGTELESAEAAQLENENGKAESTEVDSNEVEINEAGTNEAENNGVESSNAETAEAENNGAESSEAENNEAGTAENDSTEGVSSESADNEPSEINEESEDAR